MHSAKALHQPQNSPPFGAYAGMSVGAETASQVGVWRWDLESGRIEISERMQDICGLSVDHFAWPLQECVQLVHAEDRVRVRAVLQGAFRRRCPFSFPVRIERSDGGRRTLVIEGGPTETGNSGASELIGVCRDISTRTTTVSFADESPVGQLELRLWDIIAKVPAMISLKDLDHRYRMANLEVAKLAGIPLEKLIGRTVSEVFPSVGPQLDAQAAEAIATRQTVRSDVELEVDGEPRTVHVITFALTDPTGKPVEVCCVATDVTESRQHQEEASLRREANELIRSALQDERMLVVRQPVVDIADGWTISEELLVRLALPAGGELLAPSAFLPMAERFGLIQDIDTWMVRQALQVAETRPVQVNLSAVTLSDSTAREAILWALRRAPDAASRLVFEITETAAAHHLDEAGAFAAALTELGCGLALDDFGTGFGSFTYLRRLPLRYLKIDRSFVTGLPGSSDDRRVVASIISIAKQFELQTIAEGVEDAETLEVLAELGADLAQGFHLGRPDPL
jgi:PAS domain S-box-containing protein